MKPTYANHAVTILVTQTTQDSPQERYYRRHNRRCVHWGCIGYCHKREAALPPLTMAVAPRLCYYRLFVLVIQQ